MTTSDPVRGFTLLEMLVVLLIAGIALTLTTQALGQYQRAHTRAIASERTGREQRLSEAWFREAVRGLYPAAREGEGRTALRFGSDDDEAVREFGGDSNGFTGVTLAPVLGGQGVPRAQAWRIERDGLGARLLLEESGRTIALSLPRARDMRLHYLDAEGELHAQWPPALGAWPQLPEAIVLELLPQADGTGGALIAAAILGPRIHFETPYEYAPM